MKFLLTVCLLSCTMHLCAQDLDISKGWKFKTGDDPQWGLVTFNDSGWASIEIGKPWESQGFTDYNGFGWYRLHITIPSSIKEKALLKEKLRFDLGKIDDGDEVYLNGKLIGRNANKSSDIKQGYYDEQRSYELRVSDSRILWDQENVIAVRVYDSGGDGGMYSGKYGISVMDVTDFVVLNTSDHTFIFGADKKVSKKITLRSTSDKYDFNGKLQILVLDPLSKAPIFKQTIGADFARDRPFEYTFKTALPENKSYQVVYHFEEDRTKKTISSSEYIPYILTPRVSSSPKINGPAVYGARPGSPFLFKIPATGEKPLEYKVTNLPAGLQADSKTGIITGSIQQKGRYIVKLSAKNKLGTAVKNFTIICGDQIGLTPALGWNSWNCWALSVSDEKVKASARMMIDKLADHGWSYINIDDGWEAKRNENGEILANNKFPDMKALSSYIHSLGLKIGIYSSPGTLTCGGYTASYQHEEQDAKTYGEWGIDYLKYDWCSYGQIAPAKPSLEEYKKPYQVMRTALDKNKRDILYSMCQYGMGDVWKWGAEVGGNSWRTTGDINDSWESLYAIGFKQDIPAPYAQPGHFNDPDMLVVGKVGWGPSLHDTRLTPDEQYTHISLWALLSAPLLIGCDMSQLDDFTLNLLTNDEVLAIDQDVLGKGAEKVLEKDKIQYWVKTLADGNKAIGIFNLNDEPVKTTLNLADLKIDGKLTLRDVWQQKNLTSVNRNFETAVPAHGVILLKTHRLIK